MKVYCYICLMAVASLLFVGCSGKGSVSQEAEQEKLTYLIDRYIESINRCDTALVNRIWSHEDYVSFIGPSGYYSTHSEIRDSLVLGLFGTAFSKRNLRKDNLKLSIDGNIAWSEFTWVFDAVRMDGTPHHTKGRETQIFQKGENGAWVLIHIHYSALK